MAESANQHAYLGGNQNLNGTRLKQTLDNALVLLVKCLVIVTDTVLKTFSQTLVVDVIQMRLKILKFDVEEQVGLVIGRTMSEDVVDGESTLPS